MLIRYKGQSASQSLQQTLPSYTDQQPLEQIQAVMHEDVKHLRPFEDDILEAQPAMVQQNHPPSDKKEATRRPD